MSAPDRSPLLLQRLAAQNRRSQLHIGGIRQHVVVGINRNAARAAESFDRKRRGRAHNFDPLVFGFAVGVNTQIHRHPEEVEILSDLPGDSEARGSVLLSLRFARQSSRPDGMLCISP